MVNIVQHQTAHPSDAVTAKGTQYSYNITLFDNSNPRNVIDGTEDKLLYIQNGATQGIDSLLPQVFEIASGSKRRLPRIYT